MATDFELALFEEELQEVRCLPEAGRWALERDELVRNNVTTESLSELKPSFAKAGEAEGYAEMIRDRYPRVGRLNYVHHAGNSSGIADGAGLVVEPQRGRVSDRVPGARARGRLSRKSYVRSRRRVLLAPASAVLPQRGHRRQSHAVEAWLALRAAGLVPAG